jgi:hypothetical protein
MFSLLSACASSVCRSFAVFPAVFSAAFLLFFGCFLAHVGISASLGAVFCLGKQNLMGMSTEVLLFCVVATIATFVIVGIYATAAPRQRNRSFKHGNWGNYTEATPQSASPMPPPMPTGPRV